MGFNGVSTIHLTNDAGVSRAIKTGASPLRISDNETIEKVALASEPVSPVAKRTNNKITSVAGILRSKIDKNMSVAYGDQKSRY